MQFGKLLQAGLYLQVNGLRFSSWDTDEVCARTIQIAQLSEREAGLPAVKDAERFLAQGVSQALLSEE